MTTSRTERPNLFFRLTTLAGAVFVLTILASVAAVFSDPRSPPAVFFDAHGGQVLLAEVCVILATGLFAMIVDRRQTLRAQRQDGDGSWDSTEHSSTAAGLRSREGSTTKDTNRRESQTDC